MFSFSRRIQFSIFLLRAGRARVCARRPRAVGGHGPGAPPLAGDLVLIRTFHIISRIRFMSRVQHLRDFHILTVSGTAKKGAAFRTMRLLPLCKAQEQTL